MHIGEIAFRFGRRIGKHPLAGRLFCLVERVLPVRRVARQDGLVAFHHPRPMADPHILVVPTHPFASLVTPGIDQNVKRATLWRMVRLAREIADEHAPDDVWQLVINGGNRQDIGQLHGHLLIVDRGTTAAGLAMSDPDLESSNWNEIFAELMRADTVASNGYSLEFQWIKHLTPTARVTQSHANV